MALVTAGLMNKQIAAEIGMTEITVKVHRGNVMRKTGATSLAELVRWQTCSAFKSRDSGTIARQALSPPRTRETCNRANDYPKVA